MAYKNAVITPWHTRRVVRKCWKLYIIWQQTQHDVDYHLYLTQRELAEVAIASGPPSLKEEFTLP